MKIWAILVGCTFPLVHTCNTNEIRSETELRSCETINVGPLSSSSEENYVLNLLSASLLSEESATRSLVVVDSNLSSNGFIELSFTLRRQAYLDVVDARGVTLDTASLVQISDAVLASECLGHGFELIIDDSLDVAALLDDRRSFSVVVGDIVSPGENWLYMHPDSEDVPVTGTISSVDSNELTASINWDLSEGSVWSAVNSDEKFCSFQVLQRILELNPSHPRAFLSIPGALSYDVTFSMDSALDECVSKEGLHGSRVEVSANHGGEALAVISLIELCSQADWSVVVDDLWFEVECVECGDASIQLTVSTRLDLGGVVVTEQPTEEFSAEETTEDSMAEAHIEQEYEGDVNEPEEEAEAEVEEECVDCEGEGVESSDMSQESAGNNDNNDWVEELWRNWSNLVSFVRQSGIQLWDELKVHLNARCVDVVEEYLDLIPSEVIITASTVLVGFVTAVFIWLFRWRPAAVPTTPNIPESKSDNSVVGREEKVTEVIEPTNSPEEQVQTVDEVLVTEKPIMRVAAFNRDAFTGMNPARHKNALREYLVPLVEYYEPDLADQVIRRLMMMNIDDLTLMLEKPEVLPEVVKQAVIVVNSQQNSRPTPRTTNNSCTVM